jgi:hypothetical protein
MTPCRKGPRFHPDIRGRFTWQKQINLFNGIA